MGKDTIDIARSATAPCLLVVRPTGVTLTSDVQGNIPDPGRRVVRDSKGRFFATNAVGQPGIITVWDSTGRFLTSLGRPGEGPGELNPLGALAIFTGPSDRLFVRDGASVWSIFGVDLHLLRQVRGHETGFLPSSTVVLDDGSILSADGNRGVDKGHFTVVDLDGGTSRSFGRPEDLLLESGTRPRVAYVSGETFWSASVTRAGYQLQQWTTRGDIVRTIRRLIDLRSDNSLIEDARRPAPNVTLLHLDRDGLLTVYVSYPNSKWRNTEETSDPAARNSFFTVLVEVIDPAGGKLLTSERQLGTDLLSSHPRGFFKATSLGYRVAETTDGLHAVEIMRYTIERR